MTIYEFMTNCMDKRAQYIKVWDIKREKIVYKGWYDKLECDLYNKHFYKFRVKNDDIIFNCFFE